MPRRHARLLGAAACILLLTAGAEAQPPAPPRLGGTVNVLAVWGGSELDSFRAMVKPFEQRTGVTVAYEGTRDLNAVLIARIQGGHPPDVAALPGPGQMAELARAGHLKPLDGVVDLPRMTQEYARTWLDLGRQRSRLYSVFIKTALKGLVWYDPKALAAAGYRAPRTWRDLEALTDKIAAHGVAPWCIGLESGAASGWPATDWIEILLLKSAGPEVYTQWYEHKIPWTAPAIRTAWETFGRFAANPKYVYGGTQAVLATNFAEAPFPMFASPPKCYLHLQATFIQDFIQKQYPKLRPGEDLAFAPFPPIIPTEVAAIEIAGDLVGMLRDTPQTRALIRYLVTAEAQTVWVRRGGALSPNRRISPADYPDPLSRRAAAILVASEVARFDASDMMPQAVQSAFFKATLDYVQAPGRLPEILAGLERTSQEAYR